MSVGRLEGSPITLVPRGIGAPDYAQPLPLGQIPIQQATPVHSMTDVAELARRQGNINRFDGRGYTILQEDFEDSIARWEAIYPAVVIAQSNAAARTGAYSLLIDVPLSDTGGARAASPYPVVSRLGLEASFIIPALDGKLSMMLSIYDGTNWMLAGAHYYNDTNLLAVESTVPVESPVDTTYLTTYSTINWNTIKLVIDVANGYYERIICNSTEYDITAIPFFTTPSTTSPYATIAMYWKNDDAVSAADFHFDDVIFTQLEPANEKS